LKSAGIDGDKLALQQEIKTLKENVKKSGKNIWARTTALYTLKTKQTEILTKIEKELKLDPRVKLSTYAHRNDFIVYRAMHQGKKSRASILNNAPDSTQILGINANSFLKEVKRFQYFEDIILTNPANGEVIDSSKFNLRYFSYQPKNKLAVKEDVIPDGNEGANDFVAVDDSGYFRIASVDIVERKLSNEDYFSFTSRVQIDGNEYYLTGLISNDKYNAEVRAVSIWVIMISIVFLIFLVLALPVAKPFILSKKERLQGIDVTTASLGLVFGMAAFTLFIVGIHTFSVKEMDLVDLKLDQYTNTLSNQFEDEVSTKIILLNKLAHRYSNTTKYVDSLNKYLEDQNMRFLRINEKGSAFYFKLAPVEDAQDRASVVVLSNEIDLSHRNYFKVYKAQNAKGVWKYNGSTSKKIPKQNYFVESIFSLSTGKYETVVAVESKDTFPLLASVSQFQSINNVFLEPNYSFCIIDKEGVIHYHSDQAKIHNEDFLQETSLNDHVRGYLKNHSSAHLSLNYSLNDYRAKISPLANTPWHLVTFYDIKKSRLTVTSSMAVTFEILLALLLYMMSIHLFFSSLHKRKVRKGQPTYAYLFLNPISNTSKNYWWLSAVNAALILFLYTFYRYNALDVLLNLTMFLAVLSFGLLFNYSILSQSFNNLEDDQVVLPPAQSKLFEFSLLALTIIWMSATAFLIVDLSGWSFILVLCAGIGLYIYHAFGKGKIPRTSGESTKTSGFNAFYVHTFSWVFMLSVVPALLFFKPAFNQQNVKRTLNNLQDEHTILHERREFKNLKKGDIYNSSDAKNVSSEKGSLTTNRFSRKFIELISPYFNEDGRDLKGQYANELLDLDIKLKSQKSEFRSFFEVSASPRNAFKNEIELRPSTTSAFDLPNIFANLNTLYAFIFWLIILGAAIALFGVIKQLSNKFFYLAVLQKVNAFEPKECHVALDDNDVEKALPKDEEEQQYIMLVGPPYAGRNAYAKSMIKNVDKIRYLDFLNNIELEIKKVLPKTDDGNGKVDKPEATFLDSPIIINNFDYRIFDFEHNIYKLELLEEVVRYRNENQVDEKLIIISSFSTSQLIDIYNEKIKSIASTNPEEAAVLRNTVYRWESILHGFSKQIVPLIHVPSKDLIENELSVGNALARLKPQVIAYRDKLERNSPDLDSAEKDSRILNYIVDAAQNYYFAMWNTCSKEEKFLLFDLAQDGLLNIKNEKVIYDLVRKGILEANPTLRIFNQSFAEFIINAISEEEGTQMEREAKKEGVWNTYKFLAIFIVLLIVVFLSFVERQAFTKITGVVSIGAMLLPNIIKVFNSIGSSGKFFNRS